MFILAPSTVWNPDAFETRSVPRKVFGRIALLPRRGGSGRLWLRIIAENQILRFIFPLLPVVAAMLIWPNLALPIAHAPVPMILAIGVFEMKVLRLSPDARANIISEDDAARVIDGLRFRATGVLRRIAAGRDMSAGEIMLVVEQSELARLSPLTVVSLQTRSPEPQVLDLSVEERAAIENGLFSDDVTEAQLHRANLRDNEFIRSVAFDTRGVSAHARLAARLRPLAHVAPA